MENKKRLWKLCGQGFYQFKVKVSDLKGVSVDFEVSKILLVFDLVIDQKKNCLKSVHDMEQLLFVLEFRNLTSKGIKMVVESKNLFFRKIQLVSNLVIDQFFFLSTHTTLY